MTAARAIVWRRDAWCPIPTRPNHATRPLDDVDGVMFHHTGTPRVAHQPGVNALTAWALSVVRFSIDMRGDADCEYHAMIGSPWNDPNLGILYGARDVQWVGAHAKNNLPGETRPANYTRLGCALLGSYDTDRVTPGMDAAMRLYVYLSALTLHRQPKVDWHREVEGFPTDCPGEHVIAECEHLRTI